MRYGAVWHVFGSLACTLYLSDGVGEVQETEQRLNDQFRISLGKGSLWFTQRYFMERYKILDGKYAGSSGVGESGFALVLMGWLKLGWHGWFGGLGPVWLG